ncbi:endonuclease domain-containing 1 protein [Amia ocellicauda]|uniref:endonuclease domain-containing 1 protein n=1 Tax=Amia ocellicauda TaxID=2972642 RepID=UPI00346458F7
MRLQSQLCFFACILLPCLTEVTEFKNCKEFFIRVPNINNQGEQYKQICQFYNNAVRFATLYDTKRRIPVYSAYVFEDVSCQEPRPTPTWMIEPQLVDEKLQKNMMTAGQLKNPAVMQSQAVIEDYENSGFDKGHLVPVCHRSSKDSKISTFTLTNAVPQNPSFNRGKWRVQETELKAYIMKNCQKDQNNKPLAKLITGAIPGNNWVKVDRVNIPSRMWSAFTCVVNNTNVVFANIADNNQTSNLKEISLTDLKNELKKHYNIDIFPFP